MICPGCSSGIPHRTDEDQQRKEIARHFVDRHLLSAARATLLAVRLVKDEALAPEDLAQLGGIAEAAPLPKTRTDPFGLDANGIKKHVEPESTTVAPQPVLPVAGRTSAAPPSDHAPNIRGSIPAPKETVMANRPCGCGPKGRHLKTCALRKGGAASAEKKTAKPRTGGGSASKPRAAVSRNGADPILTEAASILDRAIGDLDRKIDTLTATRTKLQDARAAL